MRSNLSFAVICLLVPAVGWTNELSPTERTTNDGNVVLQAVPEVPPEVVEGLRRYQNVRGANFQAWSEDGRAIYISTRFAEVSQLHRVDMAGGARHQLTFFDEPVRGTSRPPGASNLVFTMDEGGSEFFQIFDFDPISGEHRRLTDGTSRNGSPSFSRDGKQMAYRSTRRNGSSNDVWMMNPANPDSARLLVEAPDGTLWFPGDWSPDGSKLLILNYISITDSRIHLLDVATGEMTVVAGGAENPASYLGVDPTFTADGESLLLATDLEGEFTQLYRRGLSGGPLEPVTEDIRWNVSALALSDDRSRAAFATNEDGVSRLYLLDPDSLAIERVDAVQAGVVGSMAFSPDGERLALTLSSSRTPGDVFTVDLASAGRPMARWTTSEVGGLDTDQFAEPELVHYESFDGRMIPAFVYRPATPGPHPVVLSIHGGPEGQFRPRFNGTIQTWVGELGVAVIAPNVRGSAGYGKSYLRLDNGVLREDSVKDIGALLDWIASQDDLDAERVAVYGGSYGGYMVLASLVHYSARLRAAVDIVGISNFVTFLENTQDYRRDLRRPEYGDERDPEMRAHLERISPNRHVDRMTSPLFVAQGQNDPRVPVTESEQIVRDVRAAGQEVWYMNALNEGHGFRRKENRDLFQQLTVLFFERHLLASSR